MYKAGTTYLRLVKKEIPWLGRPRRDFIKLLKKDIVTYCENNPNTNVDALIEEFGEPRGIAENFVQNLNLDALKQSAKVAAVVKFVLIAALVFFIAFYLITYITAPTLDNGYFTEEIDIVSHTRYD